MFQQTIRTAKAPDIREVANTFTRTEKRPVDTNLTAEQLRLNEETRLDNARIDSRKKMTLVEHSTAKLEAQNDKTLLNELAEKYTEEMYINGLADIIVESYILDYEYLTENYETLKKEAISNVKSFMSTDAFDYKKDGNIVIRELYESSEFIGKRLSEMYFSKTDEAAFEHEKKTLYEDMRSLLIEEALVGISNVKSIVTNTIKREMDEATKIKNLSESLEGDALLESAGGTKVSALKLRQLEEISKPTLYRTLNSIVNEQYLIENSDVSNYTEKDMENIMGGSIKFLTLVESMNVFQLVDVDPIKFNKSLKRLGIK